MADVARWENEGGAIDRRLAIGDATTDDAASRGGGRFERVVAQADSGRETSARSALRAAQATREA